MQADSMRIGCDAYEKKLWIMFFNVRILKSSPLAMDDSEYAAVEAATFAYSEKDAYSQLLQQLQNSRLELIDIYKCLPFDGVKWVFSSEHKADILQLTDEVKFSGEFRFGVFR